MKLEPDHEDVHAAAKSGDTDEVAALLSMDNRLTRTFDADGWTPLHLAAHYGHADTVEILVHNNAPVDLRSTNAMTNTALHAALASSLLPTSANLKFKVKQCSLHTPSV